MIKKLNTVMNWDADYIKFRVSDNNNSSDASTFHRDLIAQQDVFIPSFTCLSYLDTTVMEVIPKTHKKLFINIFNIVNIYSERVHIEINPGDMLLFYSSLLHRGIFTKNKNSRKLVQIFEVFPNNQLLNTYKDKILHVRREESYSSIMPIISKYSVPIYFFNLLGYINASTGYGKLDNIPENVLYLSQESIQGREVIKKGELQPTNKFIVKYKTNDLDKSLNSSFNYQCYHRKMYIGMFITLILFLVLYKLYKIIKKNYK